MSHIAIILGTAREGRQSEKVARYVQRQANAEGWETTLVDVRSYMKHAQTSSMEEQRQNDYANIVRNADALLIVTPEYNHGFPGELKLLLDQLYKEYEGKPVAVCGVSSGGLGGARCVELLRPILAAFGMLQAKNAVYFSNVESLFDDTGRIIGGQYEGRVNQLLEEIAHLIG